MSKINKILLYIIVALLLSSSALLYFDMGMKGYPDGHLTGLDRAEKPLFYSLCLLLTISGFFLVYLAGFSKWPKRNVLFYRTLIFFLIVISTFIGIDQYLTSILDNGRGG